MNIPLTTLDFIRNVFRSCNQKVSNKLSKNPGSWETSLDQTFIEHLSGFAAPFQTEKNCVVHIETHFLGGMRHWGQWEIADIGILVIFRQNGKTVKSKIGLLQSKRLYANELEGKDEDSPDNYIVGFGRLFSSDARFKKIIAPRVFHFDESSKYRAVKTKDDQWKAIEAYQNNSKIPVHYLLYNPCRIPHEIESPLRADIDFTSYSAGARVLPSRIVHSRFNKEPNNYSPNYGDLKFTLENPFSEKANEGGWRLEDFICDQFIPCHEGYVIKDDDDEQLFNVFYRRNGPIAAAFSITFDMTGSIA